MAGYAPESAEQCVRPDGTSSGWRAISDRETTWLDEPSGPHAASTAEATTARLIAWTCWRIPLEEHRARRWKFPKFAPPPRMVTGSSRPPTGYDRRPWRRIGSCSTDQA